MPLLLTGNDLVGYDNLPAVPKDHPTTVQQAIDRIAAFIVGPIT